MKFLCEDSCIDSGSLDNLSRFGVPITHNYLRGKEYEIDEKQLRRLTSISLFPEFFAYADDLARVWVDQHNDELCDIVDARKLPYRKLTAEEEANDRAVAKTGQGEYTLPHGPVSIYKPKLVRKGQSVADAFSKGIPSPLVAAPESVSLQRKAPVEPKKNGRKPMSAEARKAAGERLAAARAKKREKVTA
jgi:hypothetical protein